MEYLAILPFAFLGIVFYCLCKSAGEQDDATDKLQDSMRRSNAKI